MTCDHNTTRLEEFFVKATDGVLRGKEQAELNELLQEKENLRHYLRFVETVSALRMPQIVSIPARLIHYGRWLTAGALVAAGIALAFALWTKAPKPMEKQTFAKETSLAKQGTFFSDQEFDRRIIAIRKKVRRVSTGRQFSQSSKPYPRLQQRIRRLKKQPIF